MISELKLNDFLKKDGQSCCALLLGLRNDYDLHQSPPLDITSSGVMFKWRILLHILPAKRRCLHHPVLNAACLSARMFCLRKTNLTKSLFQNPIFFRWKIKKQRFFRFYGISVHFFLKPAWQSAREVIYYTYSLSECNSAGRVSRCQRDCRRFESGHSLHFFASPTVCDKSSYRFPAWNIRKLIYF